jgi:hypothetical protein
MTQQRRDPSLSSSESKELREMDLLRHAYKLEELLLVQELELGRQFVFHSVFACPVSREQSTPDNSPMLLPCGHVLCKVSLQKIAKGNVRPFKCPYCPAEATLSNCRAIFFPDIRSPSTQV